MPSRPVFIFANGDANDSALARHLIRATRDPFVIAADGGVYNAERFGLQPDLIIGDMDSVDEQHLHRFAERGMQIKRYPRDKDETDLELALQHAIDRQADAIRIFGGIGSRVDQTLGNIYLLTLPELGTVDVRLIAGEQQVWLARPGTHMVDGSSGDTLSLIPLAGEVSGITTQNLYYPLSNETLHFGPARGMSNRLTASRATITFHSGMLLVIHTNGDAE